MGPSHYGWFQHCIGHSQRAQRRFFLVLLLQGPIFFSNFIEDNNLLDLNFSSSSFILCNNQLGPTRHLARLDCCLVNHIWSFNFNSYSRKHLPRISSDHARLLLVVCLHFVCNRFVFHFDNFLLNYIGCHTAIRNAWNFTPHGNPMHAFLHLISHTRSNLIS